MFKKATTSLARLFNRKNKKLIAAAVIIFISLTGLWVVNAASDSDSKEDEDIISVVKKEVEVIDFSATREKFSVTGEVVSEQAAVLSVETAGRISGLFIKTGDSIVAGSTILSLGAADEQAALTQVRASENIARTQVRQAELAVERAELNLENTRTNRQVALNNINTTFNTSNLQAYLADEDLGVRTNDDNYTPPTITGNYTSTEQGEYRINLYRSSDTSSGYSFRLRGLEADTGTVSTTSPQPLGTRGLFIQFPANFAAGPSFNRVTWVIPIPNDRGQGFIQTENERRRIEQEFSVAISQAEQGIVEAENQVVTARSQLTQAVAAVRAAEIRLGKKILIAPFSGEVDDVTVEVGEFVSPGQAIATLISVGRKEVRVQVPISVRQQITVGSEVEIENTGMGTITAIAPQSVGGAVEVVITLNNADEVVVGEVVTVHFDFTLDTVDEISLPLSAVTTINGEDALYIVKDGTVTGLPVTLGAVQGSRVKINTDISGYIIVKDALTVSPGQQVTVR